MINEIKKTICTCDYCKKRTIEINTILDNKETLKNKLNSLGFNYISNLGEIIICNECYKKISKHIPTMLEDRVTYIGGDNKYGLISGEKYEVSELTYLNSITSSYDKENKAIYVSNKEGWQVKLLLGEYVFNLGI